MPNRRAKSALADASFEVGGAVPLSITPTDVAQFIRLEQCQRSLRLRLHETQRDRNFLAPLGLAAQRITPLLTRSGQDFEALITEQITARFPTTDCSTLDAQRQPDNDRLLAAIAALVPGATAVFLQPRLAARLGDWRLTGDADVVKLTRDAQGALDVLIVDIKSSITAKVEHRLQVAFYDQMLAAVIAAAGLPPATIRTGILYREGHQAETALATPDRLALDAARALAGAELGATGSLLELVAEPDAYRQAVGDLVTAPGSVAARVAAAPFPAVPFHLSVKCDTCLHNELCMKWSAERDDLSLLPHLSEPEKQSLAAAGVDSIQQLAHLKEPGRRPDTGQPDAAALTAPPSTAALVRRLGATWPVGPRLDELIHRARRYRAFNGEPMPSLPFIPSKGKGSLPYLAPDQNPNLVRVYLDAQHDYLNDRIYLAGALVTGAAQGKADPHRRACVVELTDGPPTGADRERDLLVRWIDGILRAVLAVAAPDPAGEPNAPIHLIFYDRYDQTVLMDALSRHAASVLAATPLYDFMSQLAAFDSPILSYLTDEMRELKNYPMASQSLQSVSTYLKFDWRQPLDFRTLFRERMFDYIGRLDDGQAGAKPDWYLQRARFSSQIPLEYAYAAWGDLDAAPAAGEDRFASYRGVSRETLLAFQRRRLEAMEAITRDFTGNRDTTKAPFRLPDLARFDDRARNLADALAEFLAIERHIVLGQWKAIRQLPPERRVLSGDSLIVSYRPADQLPGVAAQNRENQRRRELRAEFTAAWREANPEKKQVRLAKEQKAESDWTNEGLTFRLRVETADIDTGLDELLALSRFSVGSQLLLNKRWTVDGRLPVADQVPLQPTARQMLYFSQQATITAIEVERDDAGTARAAFVHVTLSGWPAADGEYVFRKHDRPLDDDETYVLDEQIDDWTGAHAAKVVTALRAGGRNTLFERITSSNLLPDQAPWPTAAATGQAAFAAGLAALAARGAFHGLSPAVRSYIGEHGPTPLLLVQGPPGTGKSYSTAFALFARLQGALAADVPYRVLLCCNTHSAIDVLLENLVRVRSLLAQFEANQPDLFAAFFDARLLDMPLFRLKPRESPVAGALPLYGKSEASERKLKQPLMADAITEPLWSIAGGTPSAIKSLVSDKWSNAELLGHALVDCLVLDEASRTNLPEALMAALPLKPEGQIIVVGDHRQMPPIVQHDWANERRRTFAEYQSYESLFDTLRDRGLPGKPVFPMIKLDESFRLHQEMAEYLRREVYRHDGIAYHSRQQALIAPLATADPFLRAVLDPAYPIVVVVHDERASQQRNRFEQALIEPIMAALGDAGFDPETGLGVVVPHRAQRAAMQQAMHAQIVAAGGDPATTHNAVDTVERYQGGERRVMIVSATESDPAYVLQRSGFLLDPRRLTVALSRAKQKLILVASRSIFELFSPDEAVFANAQLWKNLLYRTCTEQLWRGSIAGTDVVVWGKPAPPLPPNGAEPDRGGP